FCDAHRQAERFLGKFVQAMEARAAAREDKSRWNLAVESGALQIVTDEREQFHGARLDDVCEHVREDVARGSVADTGDLDGTIFFHERGCGVAVAALDSFRFRNRRAQTDSE